MAKQLEKKTLLSLFSIGYYARTAHGSKIYPKLKEGCSHLCTYVPRHVASIILRELQDGKFQIKFKAPPSYAGNCPALLIPNGAIDGSNGRESQSSAATSLRDGMYPISDMF